MSWPEAFFLAAAAWAGAFAIYAVCRYGAFSIEFADGKATDGVSMDGGDGMRRPVTGSHRGLRRAPETRAVPVMPRASGPSARVGE
jgi:hypothetical protein